MYRNLNTTALGISGRQSELIELALTYRYQGIDLDMGDMVKRVRVRGRDHACRFIESAKIKIGAFDLPIDWQGDEPAFKSALVELNEIAEVASALRAFSCIATVMPSSENLPYHENFEFHRMRFAEMANVLQQHGIKLGLAFLAAPEHREGKTYEFIHQAEAMLTLLKTIGNSNVGLMLDVWNWRVGGGAMDQLEDLTVEQFAGIRLSDLPESADLSDIPDKQRELPRVDGQIDCVSVLRRLGQLEYDGPVTVYPDSSCFAGSTRDAIIQKATASLDQIWNAVGLDRTGKLQATATEQS